MSAAVNDRPHEIVPAVHLPLTGELHPLRREFARWLATGNMITITLAMVICASIYFWPRPELIRGPGIDKLLQDHGVFPSPPPIIERGGGEDIGLQVSVIPDVANFEPTRDEDLKIAPEVNEMLGGGEGTDEPVGPIGELYGSGPPLEIEPPAPQPSEMFNWFDTEPVMLSITPPAYPEMVKDAGIDGTVQVRVFIGLNGHVKDAYVVEGSTALREAALASARTAFFKPARQGTHPVEVWVVIPITFQLSNRY